MKIFYARLFIFLTLFYLVIGFFLIKPEARIVALVFYTVTLFFTIIIPLLFKK
jgi:hypothetical protein